MASFVLFLGLILFASLSQARVQDIFINSSEQVILQADHCSEVQQQVDVLESLSNPLDPRHCGEPQKIEKFLFWGGGCEADITNCLPEPIRSDHGKRGQIKGPNCWNLALVVADILPALIYTTPDAMSFFISSPLCRQLANNEERKPGDIGAIRRRWGTEVHGFVYLSEDLVYSKNNAFESPYSLYGLESLYEFFKINKEPGHCLDNHMERDCFKGVEFFRCISMQKYFVTNHIHSNSLMELLEKLKVLELRVSEVVFSGEVLRSQSLSYLLDFKQSFANYIQNEFTSAGRLVSSENQSFVLGMLKSRLSGVFDQLYMIEKSEKLNLETDEIHQLSKLVQQAKSVVTRLLKNNSNLKK